MNHGFEKFDFGSRPAQERAATVHRSRMGQAQHERSRHHMCHRCQPLQRVVNQAWTEFRSNESGYALSSLLPSTIPGLFEVSHRLDGWPRSGNAAGARQGRRDPNSEAKLILAIHHAAFVIQIVNFALRECVIFAAPSFVVMVVRSHHSGRPFGSSASRRLPGMDHRRGGRFDRRC